MIRFAIALLLLAVATPSRGEDLARFSGDYAGCAVSGDDWVPIATTLTIDGETFSGTYIFIEPSGRRVPGSLSFASRENGRITWSWRDIYGVGEATFRFTASGDRFDGDWTGGGRRFPWNGVRQGSGLPLPDCGAPVS